MSMVIYPYRHLSGLYMKKKSMLYGRVEVNPKVALEFRSENTYIVGEVNFAHLYICALLNRESE